MKKALKKLQAILALWMIILVSTGTVFADVPLFFPSERDYFSNSGYRLDTKPGLADFDGDGDLDIAVGYDQEGVFRIFENTGDGTYRVAGTYATAAEVRDSKIVAEDLDGDGDADLAIGTNSGIEVFMNQGGWTFTLTGTYAAGTWMTAGDLDGDGDVDLVTEGIYVLTNNGDGTFSVNGEYSAGGSVAIGDLNGDGFLDIASSGIISWWNSTKGKVFINDGTGTFTETGEIDASGWEIVLADLDSDGDLDAATSGRDGIAVNLNNGDGTFTPGEPVFISSWTDDLISADFNGDGIPDLAAYDNTEVWVMINNGDGTFNSSIQGYFGCGSAYMDTGDVDGDGDLDLVLTETDGCGEIGIIMNNGDGTFADDLTITDDELGDSPWSVATADFNGDGLNDMAVGLWNGNVKILFNVDGESFTMGPEYETTDSDLAAADFDGDGDVDLATSGVDILLNDGTGTFTLAATYEESGGYVEAADVDLDGDMDIVSSDVKVYLNDGSGNFASPLEYPDAGGDITWGEFAVGDLNGDGYPDIVVSTGRRYSQSKVTVSLNDGTGAFTTSTEYLTATRSDNEDGFGVALGDVDNDGDMDIAVSIRYWKQWPERGSGSRLRILENDGTGDFTTQNTYDIVLGGNGDAYGLTSGDFNGDGHIDFAIATCLHSVAVALNNGDGTFYAEGFYSGVCGMGNDLEIESGDLNMDGIPDIVTFEDVGADAIRVLFSNTPGEEAVRATAEDIITKINALLAGGVTADGVEDIISDLTGLESLIRSLINSGAVGKGEGRAMLAKVNAATAGAERASASLGGKSKNASNMLNAARNELTALLNFLAARS